MTAALQQPCRPEPPLGAGRPRRSAVRAGLWAAPAWTACGLGCGSEAFAPQGTVDPQASVSSQAPRCDLRELLVGEETAEPHAAGPAVLVFLRTDCPFANQYAPELRRLHAAFAARGARFFFLYPDADESEADIAQHARDFELLGPWRRDPG